MGADLVDVKERVLAVAQAMVRHDLVVGTAGNVSARAAGGAVVMTPSSVPYDQITVDTLSVVDLDGTHLSGGKPTSERSLHLSCYRRYPEVGGVIHCHPRYGSMFAVAREPIPAVIEEVIVYLGGDVPVCDYRTTGTDELAEEVSAHVGDRSVALMANHGMLAVGKDVDDALHNALLAERTAEVVYGARVLGRVTELPPEIRANFGNVYGYLRGQVWRPAGEGAAHGQ